jgi:hypothetical protein
MQLWGRNLNAGPGDTDDRVAFSMPPTKNDITLEG